MAATVRLAETSSTFIPGWRLEVNGEVMPPRTIWRVSSPFGEVEPVVVCHTDGTPNFDRPSYAEAPHVNVVPWGVDNAGVVKIGVIRQPRPHADDPVPGNGNGNEVVVGQTPMGFLERFTGESLEVAAVRETGEETGARTVLNIVQPNYPFHNPNPTFVRTWADLYFVQVDLDRIEVLRPDRHEPIYSAEYITATDLLKRIRDGTDEEGAVYRGCTSLSIWMIFFATFPEFFIA